MRPGSWIGLAALVLLVGPAYGGSKTPVTVKFVLEAYQAHFTAAERADLEAKAAARVAERLRAYVPHFDFTSAAGQPFVLTIRLAPRLAAERPDAPKEVGLHLELTGPKVARAREYVVFRVPEDTRPITKVDDMVQEIDERLPESEYAGRIADLVVKVPIAQSGRVIYQPRIGWLLPHKVAEICLDLGSRLAFESKVPAPGGTRLTPPLEARAVTEFDPGALAHLHTFRNTIFSEPDDPSRFRQEMSGVPEEQVVVNGVWIKKRESAAECVR